MEKQSTLIQNKNSKNEIQLNKSLIIFIFILSLFHSISLSLEIDQKSSEFTNLLLMLLSLAILLIFSYFIFCAFLENSYTESFEYFSISHIVTGTTFIMTMYLVPLFILQTFKGGFGGIIVIFYTLYLFIIYGIFMIWNYFCFSFNYLIGKYLKNKIFGILLYFIPFILILLEIGI